MQEETKETQPSDLAEAITAGLAVAYRKMLEFKQYKGTPVVVSENGQIKHLNPSDLLKALDENDGVSEDFLPERAEQFQAERESLDTE